jgi:hypothetical protein
MTMAAVDIQAMFIIAPVALPFAARSAAALSLSHVLPMPRLPNQH